jgi:citrate lyase subunit beta/citryl-CoA lyase
MAAKAAGIDALDTIYSNVKDIEGLKEETKLIKKLGFSGKAVIHPNQIKPIHEVFNPTEKEIKESKKIVSAAKAAEEKGLGAITVNDKMIDYPIVDRAKKILSYAESTSK